MSPASYLQMTRSGRVVWLSHTRPQATPMLQELLHGTSCPSSNKKILNSNEISIFKDSDGNIVETNMFQYDIEKNLFSSIGKIKVEDIIIGKIPLMIKSDF